MIAVHENCEELRIRPTSHVQSRVYTPSRAESPVYDEGSGEKVFRGWARTLRCGEAKLKEGKWRLGKQRLWPGVGKFAGRAAVECGERVYPRGIRVRVAAKGLSGRKG